MEMYFLMIVILAASVSAVEETVGSQVIQACDDRLMAVIRQACEARDYDFSEFTPELHEYHMKNHYHREPTIDTSLQMQKRSLSITEACCKKTCLAKELLTYCNDE